MSDWLDVAKTVLSQIRYRSWEIHTNQYDDGSFFLHWRFRDPLGNIWKSRQWNIHKRMSVSDIIRTTFAAALQAEEHELREHFTYQSIPILSPHYDLEQITALIRDGTLRTIE